MRILALIVSLQLGCLFATTFSEYGNLIRNESSLEKKVAIAAKAFTSVEGFVPREMFMSFWSIDALGEIAPEFERRLQSDGLYSLLPDYDLIQRICSMEMGDYRYFFQDLKRDLKELEANLFRSPTVSTASKPMRDEDYVIEPAWEIELIETLVEVWIATGYGEGLSDEVVDALLAATAWTDSDIEFWERFFRHYDGDPKAIIKTLARREYVKKLTGSYLDLVELESASVELNFDRVSDGGPRLY